MFKEIIPVLLFIFLFVSINFADTSVPGGYISGTWTAAGSPYRILGDLTVHADSNLTIEPGVEVIFQGLYTFQVNGALTAVGTEMDSIAFSAADTSVGWRGIRLDAAADASSIAYARVRYGRNTDGGGIYCASPKAVITHCTISDNEASNNGGGICINTGITNPPPIINNCVISRNSARFGGGVFYVADSMNITDCIVSNNAAANTSGDAKGGGIYFDGGFSSSIYINNCIIQNNFCESDSNAVAFYGLGGGIYAHGRNNGGILISKCQILSNWSRRAGGGVFVNLGGAVILNSTISGNFNKICQLFIPGGNYLCGGGGLSFYYAASSTLSYCEITENSSGPSAYGGGGIDFKDSNASLTIDRCTISKNNSLFFGGIRAWSDLAQNPVVVLSNSILAFNGNNGASSASYGVTFCDFFNNGSVNLAGGVPGGFGTLTGINANGDSCDVYSNIFMDPLFADTLNRDFHLTENSPCIDAGDPNSPFDPDNTIADMGAYYFNQLVSQNLILNPGCEDTLVNGEIPHWTEVIGSTWAQRTAGPDPYEGLAYFFPGVAALAELQQDVDVSTFSSSIDAGFQSFVFEGYVRAYTQSPADQSRIILEFLDTLKTTKIDSIDSGNYSNTTEWIQITDTSVAPLGTRYIRIRLISTRRAGTNNDGYYDGLSLVAANITGMKEVKQNLPESPILFQNYPNPFNPITIIRFNLPQSGEVQLIVYDILGRKVSTLLNKRMPAGIYEVAWNAANYTSGLYFYQLTTSKFKKVRKMLLVK
jgi:hypothetical protein